MPRGGMKMSSKKLIFYRDAVEVIGKFSLPSPLPKFF
jgi:hypothetical protein